MNSSAPESGGPTTQMQQICRGCLEATATDGGGISLVLSGINLGTVVATDATSAKIEERQFTLGEGPCVDANTSGAPVMVSDLLDRGEGITSHWPVFLEAALALDVRAIFAFPVRLGAISFGTMDLYRSQPGPFSERQLGVALRAADAAAAALLGVDENSDEFLDGTGRGSVYMLNVHQATGMLSVQLGVDIRQAFVTLRAAAFAENRSINDLADDVVHRRRRFSREDL